MKKQTFSKGHVKNNVICIWNTFDPSAICVQCNVLQNATTVATLPNTKFVSRMVGYCLYGTLLLRPLSACPVQIRVHHHTDVYTDIN